MKLLTAFKNLRSRKARPRIFDFVRKKLVRETPEEVVRQRVLRSLYSDYGFPHNAMFCEEPVNPGETRDRADIIIRLP